MTAQLPLMLVPADAVQIGEVACLVEDEAGGRVFVRGDLVFAWNVGDELGRRLAAVQLVAIKGARAVRVAEGFGINTETLRRWDNAAAHDGLAALVPGKRGPKGPSRLSPEVVADIRAPRRGGASLRRSPPRSRSAKPRSAGHCRQPSRHQNRTSLTTTLAVTTTSTTLTVTTSMIGGLRGPATPTLPATTCPCCRHRPTARRSGPRPGGGSCPTPTLCSPPPHGCRSVSYTHLTLPTILRV